MPSKVQEKETAGAEIKEVNTLAPVKPLESATVDNKKSSNSNNSKRRPKYAQNMDKSKDKQDFTEDSTTGIASFGDDENKNKPAQKNNNGKGYKSKYYRGPYRKPLPKPDVEALPEDVEFVEYTVSESKLTCFNGPKNYMTALYPVTMTVDGNEYNSVEHYYQACKLFTLAGKDTAAMTKEATTPLEVKQLAKKLLTGKVSKGDIDGWKQNDSYQILTHAIKQKYEQNSELKEALLKTGDALLAHTYQGDTFFATAGNAKYVTEWAKKNEGTTIKVPKTLNKDTFKYVPLVGNGKNILGFITMLVRSELAEA